MDDSPFPAWFLYSHSKLNYHVSYLPPLLCMSASKTSTFNCLLVVSVEVPQKAASERLQQQLSISASLLTSPGIQAGFLVILPTSSSAKNALLEWKINIYRTVTILWHSQFYIGNVSRVGRSRFAFGFQRFANISQVRLRYYKLLFWKTDNMEKRTGKQ